MSNIPIEVFDINFGRIPAGPASQSRNEKDNPHKRPAPGVVARKRVRSAKHPPKIPPKTTPIPGARPRKKSAVAPSAPTMTPMSREEARFADGELRGRRTRFAGVRVGHDGAVAERPHASVTFYT